MRNGYIQGLASAVGTLVFLALDIALLVAVLTVVRRHRPRAVAALAAAASIGIAGHLAQPLAYGAIAVVASRSGIDSYVIASSAVSLGFAMVHAVAGVLLIVGVVRLATRDEG